MTETTARLAGLPHMKRVRHIVSVFLTTFSMILCAIMIALWAWSYNEWDSIYHYSFAMDGQLYVQTLLQLKTGDGGIQLIYWVNKRPSPSLAVPGIGFSREAPEPEGEFFAPNSETFLCKHYFAFSHTRSREQHIPGAYRRTGLLLPQWVFLVTFAVLPLLRLCKFVRRRGRTIKGGCPACGYSLTANTSGVCPECGTPVPKEPADDNVRTA
jgi:hypothetical protein